MRGVGRVPASNASTQLSFQHGAFTLIELMVAVGIMAVMLTIAMPTLYKAMHPDSMRKAMSDVMEILHEARAQAILNGQTMELCIRPIDRSFSIAAAAGSSGDEQHGRGGLPERVNYQWGDRMVNRPAPSSGSRSGGSVTLGSTIMIEGIGINGKDWTEDHECRVQFRANGTSDEFSIVLRSDKGELRNIFLEVVTGTADYEVDPQKFRDR